ncbi:MAG: hypothetical protein JST69_03010 [Bacteroidetes bacterium]|nr:hypothetical protein [Bacteroidota bacterium]
MANAIGIIDYIQQYIKLKATYNKNETLENRVTLLALSHTINNKINIASLEISSAASELDCEKERASQIANFLKGKEGQRENNLIISSIIVGAAGAIATEILSSQNSRNASTVVGLGASLTGATLGVLMLVNKKKVLFYHTRNTLGEIWNKQPTSSTLPPSIWYYLSYEDLSKNEKSLRNLLVERWLNFGQLENPKNDKKNNELYFGKGGKYTANQLKNRASMYDEIEANITIMKQDLKQLTIEFENLKTNN